MAQKIIKIFTFILCLFFIAVTGIFSHGQFKVRNELRAVEAELAKKIETELRAQERLAYEIEYNLSDAYVEKIARRQLGLIKSNEIIFIEEPAK